MAQRSWCAAFSGPPAAKRGSGAKKESGETPAAAAEGPDSIRRP
jgi:hypothetical protein